MENEFIKNIIIFDGTKEYNSLEILNSKKLYSFLTRSLINFPVSIMQKIVLENGILYVSTDENFTKADFLPKNISEELTKEINNIYN